MIDFELPLKFVVVGIAFALLMFLMYFVGVFHTISFSKTNMPPRIFVYKTHRGPLKEVGQHFEGVIRFMKDQGFDTFNIPTAGIYYENPNIVDNPRYAVGFLIDQDDTVNKQKFTKIQNDDEWSVLELKATPTIVSTFPMRWIAVSCAISAMKTYPKFEQSGHELKCGSVEIYRANTKTVETHFPQGNQDQFCPQDSDSFPGDKKKQ